VAVHGTVSYEELKAAPVRIAEEERKGDDWGQRSMVECAIIRSTSTRITRSCCACDPHLQSCRESSIRR